MAKKTKRVSRVQRFMVGELLGLVDLELVRIQNFLWRAANRYQEGLLPQERALIQKRHDEMKETAEKYRKLTHRISQSCGKWWDD